MRTILRPTVNTKNGAEDAMNRAISRAQGPAWLSAWIGLALIVATPTARAHFFWLKATRDGARPEVRAFLSETPEPDDPELLGTIADARVSIAGRPISWSKAADTYLVAIGETAPNAIDGACDLGIKSRSGTSFLLLYTARAQFGPSPLSEPSDPGDGLRLRLVDRGDKPPLIVALFRGKPTAGVKIKAFNPDAEAVELTTDAQGSVDSPGVAEGKTGLLAKWVEPASGTREGKSYSEIRHYATLTAALAPPAAKPAADLKSNASPFATMPEAVNSFGGAVLGDWLYVYSGHVGETHKYHRGTTSTHFRRLNLRDRSTWEELPSGPSLQGVTLVAHRSALYRVGGMTARNAAGEPDDLVSTASFARFDPGSRTWTELAPLPSPRSTHDAVVAGDLLYVIGGWSMPGGAASSAEFSDDALVFDLADPSKGWKTLPTPPFRRRALAVAEWNGKIYAIGGLTDDGAVVRSVDVFDPTTRAWSTGPEIPGGKKQGFAASAFRLGDALFVSGADGLVHRLDDRGDHWNEAGKLAVPRITHRMLPGISDDLLIVGGTAARTAIGSIESIPVVVGRMP